METDMKTVLLALIEGRCKILKKKDPNYHKNYNREYMKEYNKSHGFYCKACNEKISINYKKRHSETKKHIKNIEKKKLTKDMNIFESISISDLLMN